MFNTILVPVDESEASRQALDLAIRLARCDGDRILLVNVLDVSKLIAVAGYESPYPVDAISMLKEANEQLLAEAKTTCTQSGIAVELAFVEGDAVDEILRVAGEQNVGLICMGTHGRTGLSRLFVGSVCEGVLRRSNVPVLATRPSAKAEPATQKAADTHPRAAAQEAT